MITLNLIIFTLFLIIIGIIVYSFIIPAFEAKKKFRLYRLRDKLALLAMSEKVNENHEEYKFLVKNINLAINLYDRDFSITKFFEFLIEPQLSSILQIKRILSKVDRNPVLRPVFHEYFSIVKLIIKNDIKAFKFIVTCIISVFGIYEKIKLMASLIKKKTELERYKKNILEPAITETA